MNRRSSANNPVKAKRKLKNNESQKLWKMRNLDMEATAIQE
jgi:hypothetical protein